MPILTMLSMISKFFPLHSILTASHLVFLMINIAFFLASLIVLYELVGISTTHKAFERLDLTLIPCCIIVSRVT